MRTEHRRSAHSVFLLHVHRVFVTKYRHKVFTKAILDEMRSVFEQVCLEQGVQLIEFDGEADHVHLWSPSYFAGSCGGVPLEVIRQYIEQQDTPH